jgi:signal transduction histidine kinase
MTLDNFVKQQQLIEFSDNGLGIEEKNIDKICTLFRRMHNHVSGTGVGLYIVKKLVENSGGKIEVSSLVGKGTTFKIYIPKRDVTIQ